MGLRISTNLASISAQKTMASSQREIQKSFAQLSSGSRITKAADDAAGLSISETLKSTIRGYSQAQRNANDGISMVQVSEGGLGEISNILTRMRELGVQAASDTVGDDERSFIDKEVQQLKNEMQRIAKTTRWGNQNLLDGSGQEYAFQVDINNDEFNDRIAFDASEQDATISNLGVDGFDFSTKDGAREALEVLEESQTKVNGYRANLGAIQNRLISTTENLGTAIENFSAANSAIRDTDVAQSSAELARNNVLLNASVGVLAQANQQPASALRLVS
ncbi:MAG: flagellin FliC [Bdellovibrionaceae bacterium]|nr:flagellin FliC [Pseudobdellovibrionaceae bacterium]|tara:strand:+ start:509 stop:1342 length:834 start_codon:yes stop_codon:yes gene_type:complete